MDPNLRKHFIERAERVTADRSIRAAAAASIDQQRKRRAIISIGLLVVAIAAMVALRSLWS